MAKRRSLRDKRSNIKNSNFVGRKKQISVFLENLKLGVDHDSFMNIFNVYGQGGVGKTTLSHKFKDYAEKSGMKVVLIDFENIKLYSVPIVINEMAEQLIDCSGRGFKSFSKKYNSYLEKRSKLVVNQYDGVNKVESLASGTFKLGVSAASEFIPGGSVIKEFLPIDTMAEGTGKLVNKAWSKFGNKYDVEEVLRPIKSLTEIWIEDLFDYTENDAVCFIFDNYETSNPDFDYWLHNLLEEQYGAVPHNILIIVSGRAELEITRWSSLSDLLVKIPLEPFTIDEATVFLQQNGIRDVNTIETILSVSGRLPVYLALFVLENSIVDNQIVSLPTEKVVGHFLRRIANPEHKHIARLGAIPRHLNLDIIKRILDDVQEPEKLFHWLKHRSFIQKRNGKWSYHSIIREQILTYIQEESKENWVEIHNRIADYYLKMSKNMGFKSINDARESTVWVEYNLEYHYHKLCANHRTQIPDFFKSFLEFINGHKNYKDALFWLEVFIQANNTGINSKWLNVFEKGITNFVNSQQDFGSGLWKEILDSGWFNENSKLKGYLFHLMGYSKRSQGELEDAILYFEKVLDTNFNRKEVTLNNLVNLFIDNKRYNEAKTYNSKLLEDDHDSLNGRWNLGRIHSRLKEYDKAFIQFKKVLELVPNNAIAHYNLGTVYENQKKLNKAIECYKNAFKLDSNYLDPSYAIAKLLVKQEKKDLAIQQYKNILSIDPNYINAYNGLSEIYINDNNDDLAIKLFKKGIEESGPKVASFLLNKIGIIHQNKGNYTKAIDVYNEVILMDATFYAPYYNKGMCYGYLEKYDKSIESFKKSIEYSPTFSDAYCNLGVIYATLGKTKKALKYYDKSIDLNSNNDVSYFNKATIYTKQGELEQAIELYKKSIDCNPKYINAYRGIIEVLTTQKNYEQSILYCKKVLVLDSSLYLIHNVLGWNLILMDELDKAEEYLEKHKDLSDELNKVASMNIGHIKLMKKDIESAKEMYTLSLKLFNKDNHFFKGMEQDYIDLKMEDKGILLKGFEKILLDLKS
ncbi:tetratricopeptide repeat protein [Hwangdonia seohaensis]|uniref:Tetratricopeptide repeat protein n=1 Tax=Hwangdonia seohaensis TaxID=1240727 RepID=A0ABW3RAU6_9FLAO|nr:tetratricopeptide repeat protein [Hwangdonia seohaensis]